MRAWLRLLAIVATAGRYGWHEFLLPAMRPWARPWVCAAAWLLRLGQGNVQPRGARLREGLTQLGPIFVKFGQVLSTRPDLVPADVAQELALLQDRVPPFPGEQAKAIIERELGKPIEQVFAHFEPEAVASASIAQVHWARLHDGREVAVKVLRPGMQAAIEKDLGLLHRLAAWAELHPDGKRLRPREVVAEFDGHLHDELDLVREAANGSQLARNMQDLKLMLAPQMHWDLTTRQVLVMQRMGGIPVSQIQALREAGVDLKKLARDGVTIFFTQVFRDGFFHADMHPGNILVSTEAATFGRYVALDFGIVGSLSESDKQYLAHNFLAFFQRDYRRVAQLHVQSGWVPANTRVEALEGAIRAVCEPQFARPLKDISLGHILLRLFQVSRRFDVHVQPQLVLLQKTLLNVEGLGRQLDPDLDLWATAQPFLERWVKEQVGLPALAARLQAEAPYWAQALPALPRLLQESLTRAPQDGQAQLALQTQMMALQADQKRLRRRSCWLSWGFALLAVLLLLVLFGLWSEPVYFPETSV